MEIITFYKFDEQKIISKPQVDLQPEAGVDTKTGLDKETKRHFLLDIIFYSL